MSASNIPLKTLQLFGYTIEGTGDLCQVHPADKSYGIQVARLAGLPDSIIKRAKEVLANLEKEELNEVGRPRFADKKTKKGTVQLDLFSSRTDAIINEIINLDIKKLKPEEALNKLIEIKKKLSP